MQELTHLIQLYGLLAVFAAVFLDEIGFPVPALPVLVIAGAVSGANFSVSAVIGSALAAALLADLLWYWAASHLGRRVLAILCRISLAPDSCVRQTENLFDRIGSWSLIFARFVPAFTNIAVAMAAVRRVKLALFLALNFAGALLYYGAAALLGAFFHRAVADVLNTMAAFGAISIIALVAVFALYIALRWWERVTFIRQLRMDRITVEELATLMASATPPIILDVRSADARAHGGIIPGALAAHPEDIHPRLRDIPRGTEIVVYCACPNEASAATAARHLKRAGFKKIRPLLGGVEAWVGTGRQLTDIRV